MSTDLKQDNIMNVDTVALDDARGALVIIDQTRLPGEVVKLDTRRKVILGGLLIDAAGKDERFGRVIDELMKRITREHDHKTFKDWQKPEPDKS